MTDTKTKPQQSEAKVDPLTAEIVHLADCPETRTEVFEASQPDNQGGGKVCVARCIECGQDAKEVIDGSDEGRGRGSEGARG